MDQKENTSRRRFLKNTSMLTVSALTIPQLVSSVFAEQDIKKHKIVKDNIILFQGDSITDAGRKKDSPDANNAAALGGGYAMIAASTLLYEHPNKNLKILNHKETMFSKRTTQPPQTSQMCPGS